MLNVGVLQWSVLDTVPSTIGHLALSLVVLGSRGSCLSWLPHGTPAVVVVVIVVRVESLPQSRLPLWPGLLDLVPNVCCALAHAVCHLTLWHMLCAT